MIQVYILEDDDVIQEDDLYRPMYKTNFQAHLWNTVHSSWVGHRLGNIMTGGLTFEFIRGPIPKTHCLDASRRAGEEKDND